MAGYGGEGWGRVGSGFGGQVKRCWGGGRGVGRIGDFLRGDEGVWRGGGRWL